MSIEGTSQKSCTSQNTVSAETGLYHLRERSINQEPLLLNLGTLFLVFPESLLVLHQTTNTIQPRIDQDHGSVCAQASQHTVSMFYSPPRVLFPLGVGASICFVNLIQTKTMSFT